MELDPGTLSAGRAYQWMISIITPRPIAWVTTVSPDGIVNAAPFSYFTGVGSQPPTLMFSVVNKPDGTKKDTLRNIESTGEFVVNVVPHELGQLMFETSHEFPYGVSELERVGLATIPSHRVRPPGIAQSPVQLECRTLQIVCIGDGALAAHAVFGEITWMRIEDRLLNEAGEIDSERLDTIGRMGGRTYTRTRDRFKLT
ncbi:MAG TPA: flavin reductase family protein [Pirellulaceae bacterium]|nr:flavin reductase family protein [Pirellulaceae bacterium]